MTAIRPIAPVPRLNLYADLYGGLFRLRDRDLGARAPL